MPTGIAREPARTTPHACPEPDSGKVKCALQAMSRCQALAIELDGGIVVTAPGSQSRRSGPAETEIPAEIWQHLLQRGWIVPHGTQDGWRVSNAGRIALKRLLSRKGAPDLGPVPSPAPARRSSSPPAARQGTPAGVPQQNDNESPLAWLRQRRDRQGRRYVSDAQFSAGERLRHDFTYGSLTPSVTSNWSPVIGSTSRGAFADRELELRDGQLRARERFRAALAAVGPEFSGVLVDVCCYLMGLEEVEQKLAWPRRTAKVVLLLALSALARFYGIEERQTAGRTEAPRRQTPIHPPAF